MKIFVLLFCLTSCGQDKTIIVKDSPPPAENQPPIRGPIAAPKPPKKGGGLSGGGPAIENPPNEDPPPNEEPPTEDPKEPDEPVEPLPKPPKPPIPTRPVEPLPKPPEHQLPGNMWGMKDFYYNLSGRRWPWCERIPEQLRTDFDSHWGWVPDAVEWCRHWGIYQKDDGCSCRHKRL